MLHLENFDSYLLCGIAVAVVKTVLPVVIDPGTVEESLVVMAGSV